MADSDDDFDDFLTDILILWNHLNPRARRRRWWVHPILRKRQQHGEYDRLVLELQLDGERFQQYFRMTQEQFSQLFALVGQAIEKEVTNFRKPVCPRQRLAICIRFLATGDSYRSLAFSYRVSSSLIGRIVPEVCNVIWKTLKNIYIKMPSDTASWKLIAENFRMAWDSPHCVGAIDGKHVVIQSPRRSGSLYFNYKHTFSIVLLGVVDASYRFIAIDVGGYGRISDGGVFSASNLGRKLKSNKLKLPEPATLPDAPELGIAPYCMIGDEAFPLLPNLMRPYPVGQNEVTQQLIFNYRLSRARRISENAFGILGSRWWVYRKPIILEPVNARPVILATCVLHNFLQNTSTPAMVQALLTEDDNVILPYLRRIGVRPGQDAMGVREQLARYFSSNGALPWQDQHVRRGTID